MNVQLADLKQEYDLRTVWPNEACDFTPWLENNLNLLGEAIGVDLCFRERESAVGKFSLDILASEEGTDNAVVIENQLESSNHTHLGQLLTYAAGKNAKIIVWIVKQAREEHRRAMEWLNEHTDDETAFFLVEVELWRIGDSAPAVHFNILEQPNNWAKQVKNISATEGQLQSRLLNYWTDFNEYAQSNKKFIEYFKLKKPPVRTWYTFSIGASRYSLSLNVNTQTNEQRVELYISDDQEFFEYLEKHRENIQAQIDMQLEWMALPNKKASRVRLQRNIPIFDETKKVDQFNWFIKYTILLYDVFKPYVEQWK